MRKIEKISFSKLIELYRIEYYNKTGDALFSKTKFGYILKNSVLVTICSFHTYQKLLSTPEAIKDHVYIRLLEKLNLSYRLDSYYYKQNNSLLFKELYNDYLFYDFSKANKRIIELSKPLLSNYIIENEYLNLYSLFKCYYLDNKHLNKEQLEHLMQVSFLFPNELKIIIYDLCFCSYYTQHSDLDSCKKVINAIKKAKLSSIILEIDLIIFSIYTEENQNYTNKINQLLEKVINSNNFNRALDLYALKLNYFQENNGDKEKLIKEVEYILQNRPISLDKKLGWIGNIMIHYFDIGNYENVISLFKHNLFNTNVPILLILLYYSSSQVLHQNYQIIYNEFISDKKPELYYSLKKYFESDLTIKEKEELLLSFYKEIPYNDSILNKIIYNEFMLYYPKFNKRTLIQFIKENDRRIK